MTSLTAAAVALLRQSTPSISPRQTTSNARTAPFGSAAAAARAARIISCTGAAEHISGDGFARDASMFGELFHMSCCTPNSARSFSQAAPNRFAATFRRFAARSTDSLSACATMGIVLGFGIAAPLGACADCIAFSGSFNSRLVSSSSSSSPPSSSSPSLPFACLLFLRWRCFCRLRLPLDTSLSAESCRGGSAFSPPKPGGGPVKLGGSKPGGALMALQGNSSPGGEETDLALASACWPCSIGIRIDVSISGRIFAGGKPCDMDRTGCGTECWHCAPWFNGKKTGDIDALTSAAAGWA
mmetsp:Transcript_43683/g.100816  ORF Transcript_43683/g.100816 Transcript_43683/m.100816 type:complete len:299 (-) Transcript_43683:193-1089(-)